MGFFLENYSSSDVTETNGSFSQIFKNREKVFDFPKKTAKKRFIS